MTAERLNAGGDITPPQELINGQPPKFPAPSREPVNGQPPKFPAQRTELDTNEESFATGAAAWLIRPQSPCIARCESCGEKPRAGVGVLQIGSEISVICPYCMACSLAKSLSEGVLIEVAT